MKYFKIIHAYYTLLGIKHDQSCDLIDQGEVRISLSVGSCVADLLEEQLRETLLATFNSYGDCLPDAPYVCFDMDVEQFPYDE